ncbi:MAG: hypothetical protein HKO59_06570 [Phycisphaerales bacterium]|nr:hypothetical protein [Phycisphaerae bacterium]NNF41540.1 hypothetical protein [Phycisphaerales bacterium]NNM25639.1 hypothetical protein [Phycisphaerales bacterium]
MKRVVTLLLCGTPLLAACEPYRIEYHTRPAYYDRLVSEPLPDRVELDDGTIVLYNTKSGTAESRRALSKAGADEDLFRIREETEDGGVRLHALLPEHVLANMLRCLRDREYQLMWDELVAERTKLSYAAEGFGFEQFREFCDTYRLDLAKMINRMRLGLATHETVVDTLENGTIVCRFWPQTARLFRFKRVMMVREGFEVKLLMVK